MESQAPEVEDELVALYGGPLCASGVVHVTSAVRAPDGALRVIEIGVSAPPSATDFFVLNLCRARCDAVLTTGAILRSEPALVYALSGSHGAALATYRRRVLGKDDPPVCAILTRSGQLSLTHPIWHDGTPKVVLTTPEVAPGLSAKLGPRAQVIALVDLDARSAIQWLHARGHALVSIEAGPRTTGPLYESPSLVDELLLSLYEDAGEGTPLGGSLPSALLRERVCVADTLRTEASGRWRFQRWVRRAAAVCAG